MKRLYVWHYIILACFTVTAIGGNLSGQAKSLAQSGGGNQPLLIAQQNPSGYSSGDTLAPPSNQSTGNASNISGFSPGDTFGSSANQTAGAPRGCCPGGMKLIQDCLNANGSAAPGGYHLAGNPSSAPTNGGTAGDGYHLAGNSPTGGGNSGQATPQITMMLYGDGVSTVKATLELSCGGQTTLIPLQTICTSGKTKRPWPSREVALQSHVQYQLGLTDPQLLNIVQSASDQNAQGLYSKLAIAPSRQLQTMTQFATWMYEARVTGNPADIMTPQVVASDICEQSHTSVSSLSDSENKELTHSVMDMLLAADETEKHSHIVTWQPPTPSPLPPPQELYPPGSPPSASSPLWELVCIPAGTRFITTDCRYQSCMVIRCAYGKCPVCPGGPPVTSTSNVDTTMRLVKAHLLTTVRSMKQHLLNSAQAGTPKGQKLAGTINQVEKNLTAGASQNLPGASTAGVSTANQNSNGMSTYAGGGTAGGTIPNPPNASNSAPLQSALAVPPALVGAQLIWQAQQAAQQSAQAAQEAVIVAQNSAQLLQYVAQNPLQSAQYAQLAQMYAQQAAQYAREAGVDVEDYNFGYQF